jgi:hypothetical protein
MIEAPTSNPRLLAGHGTKESEFRRQQRLIAWQAPPDSGRGTRLWRSGKESLGRGVSSLSRCAVLTGPLRDMDDAHAANAKQLRDAV